MEGYTNAKTPDVGWWLAVLKAAEDWRDKKTRRKDWPTFKNYYSIGLGSEGHSYHLMPERLFYSLRRSLTSLVYFRNPTASVSPRHPNSESRLYSKLAEGVLQTVHASMGTKDTQKAIIEDAFPTGYGVGKIGFGALQSPSPELGGTEAPRRKGGAKVETESHVFKNMPWFKRIRPEDFLLPEGCSNIDSAYFCAQRVIRYWDDLKADSRFKTAGLELNSGKVDEYYKNQGIRPTVELWEIRDRRTGKVFVITSDISAGPSKQTDPRVLYFGDDELTSEIGFPFVMYVPNPADDHPYGLSDAVILEPYQVQLNNLATTIVHHVNASRIKLIVRKGALDETQKESLLNGDVGSLVEADSVNDIKMTQTGTIPQELQIQVDRIWDRVEEVIGLSPNQRGAFQSSSHGPSASEVRVVEQNAGLRLSERKDILAAMLVRVSGLVLEMVTKHWTSEETTKVLDAKGRALWVRFAPTILQAHQYRLNLDPDTAIPETANARDQRAERIYNQFLQNPLIDAQALTRFRLENAIGVDADELLRSVNTPQDAVGVEDALALGGGGGTQPQLPPQQLLQ